MRVPLPNNPLRELNSYLITSGTRPLLIDTGFNLEECARASTEALTLLGFAWEDVDILITHGHPDHCGNIGRLYREGMTVYAGFPDYDALRHAQRQHFADFIRWYRKHPAHKECYSQQSIDWDTEEFFTKEMSIPKSSVPLMMVSEGEVLERGEYRFRALRTTGHCPYHLCLYEPNEKILFSGDQILPSITPVLTSFRLENDALYEFLKTLDQLAALDVDLVLPGHREPFTTFQERLVELKSHHQARLDDIRITLEVREAFDKQKGELFDIIKAISWRNPIPDWDRWPLKQKYFSTGETLAHLIYLINRGEVQIGTDGTSARFSLV